MSRLGHATSVHARSWPVADESLLVDDFVEMVVQVNGKVRGRLTVASGADQQSAEAVARADGQIADHLVGDVVKVIHVPDKLLNFVVKA